VSQPVTLRHKVSHSVTTVTLAGLLSAVQISSSVTWANQESAEWYDKCRGCFEPDS